MKKIFFLISLMSVILVSCDQKPDTPLAEEVEQVTSVTFIDPQISIEENLVTYSVTISYSKGKEKGKEVLMKNLPILLGRGSGNVCYGCSKPTTQLGVPVVCMGDMSAHHERNWTYNEQIYVIRVDTRLSNKIMSNIQKISLPRNVMIEKYGKKFTFEDVNFTSATSQSIEKMQGKYLQKITLRLDFDGYKAESVLKNEIHTL